MEIESVLLDVNLHVDYPNKPGALKNVSFQMRRGEVLGLVGESGSGKSTIALALLKLLRWKDGRATGHMKLCGRDLMVASEREMESIRGRQIGLVLQSPLASLNPALRIGTQLGEAWRAHATAQLWRPQSGCGPVATASRASDRAGVSAALSLTGQRRSGTASADRHGVDALAHVAHCRRADQRAGCNDASGRPQHGYDIKSTHGYRGALHFARFAIRDFDLSPDHHFAQR